jgi:hypothetical protein
VTGVHLSCSVTNAFVQESVRAFCRGWLFQRQFIAGPVGGALKG